MKFSVGDSVILKELKKEAKISKILSTKVYEVLSGDSTFPVHANDIMPLHQKIITNHLSFPNLEKKKKAISINNNQPDNSEENGFYLSFQPIFENEDSEVVEDFRISFINQSTVSVKLNYQCLLSGNKHFEQTDILLSSSKPHLLHQLPIDSMNEKPEFCYTIQPVEEEVDWIRDSGFFYKDELKIRPQKLFSYLSDMHKAKRTFFVIKLACLNNKQPATKKHSVDRKNRLTLQTKSNKKPIESIKNNDAGEIDLHAENLRINTPELSNYEILIRQLQALQQAIDNAVYNSQTSLIIIHGVGKGKLKEEVHHLLDSHPSVDFYQHTWRPKYGYGATEAILK